MLKHLMTAPSRLTLAVAESVTGGRLQALVTAESGASTFFLGGITAYTLVQKVRHLGVRREAAEPVDCVSAEVAWQMARGACALFGADIGVATTGYAEPLPERDVRAPVVYWAICRRLGAGEEIRSEGRLAPPTGDRIEVQAGAAAAVYAALGEQLAAWRAGRA